MRSLLTFCLLYLVPLVFAGDGTYYGQSSPNNYQCPIERWARLPIDISPINYNLKVQFLSDNQDNFNGLVSILVNVNRSTNVIQLNAVDFTIDQRKITVQRVVKDYRSDNQLRIVSVSLKEQLLSLVLDRKLIQNQNYIITIPYVGLTRHLTSINKNDLAGQQPDPVGSRSKFPSWDEPRFKATYDIEIIHYSNLTAYSNMPAISTKAIDSVWSRTKFYRTIRLSSFTISVSVGRFSSLNPKSLPRISVKSEPNLISYGELASNFAPKIVSFYENFSPNPVRLASTQLPKIDLVALPQLAVAAREFWGITFFSEPSLLFDENAGSSLQKYVVTVQLAHQLSKLWLSDLVTPSYWNNLWLAEGLSNYYQYEAIDSIRPNWEVFQSKFILDEVHPPLRLDSLKSTHPVHDDLVRDLSQFQATFDYITFSKAASIWRMANYNFGQESILDGMDDYLNDFKFRNADQIDLFRYLQVAFNKNNVQNSYQNSVYSNSYPVSQNNDLIRFFNSWTLKGGYPLITVTRNYDTNRVLFSQRRFLLNDDDPNRSRKIQWEVPLTYTTKSEQNWNPETRLSLRENANYSDSFVETKLTNIKKDDWLIVNVQQVGYYRVTYDEDNWWLIINQLNTDAAQIHPANRIQLLDDLFDLAEGGVVSYYLPLSALEYLKNEFDPLPWLKFAKATELISSFFVDSDWPIWQQYVLGIVEPVYDWIADKVFDNDNLLYNEMQRSLVGAACVYESASCLRKTRGLFDDYMRNVTVLSNFNNQIPPNIRIVVYCASINHGNERDWNFIYNLYLREQSPSEKENLLFGLSCSANPKLQNRYFSLITNNYGNGDQQNQRPTNFTLFDSILPGRTPRQVHFRILNSKWSNTYYANNNQFDALFGRLSLRSTKKDLAIVNQLFCEIQGAINSPRAYLQIVEQIRSNINWIGKYKANVIDFLNRIIKERGVENPSNNYQKNYPNGYK